MSKVNTLFNYFTSPGNAKKGKANTPAPGGSPVTPKRVQRTTKGKKKSEGKENLNTEDRKRSLKDEDEDEEDIALCNKPKRRRIIPSEDSEDSEDTFKPDENEASSEDDSLSEAESESEPITESDEETPKKKKKFAKPAAKSKPKNTRNKSQAPKTSAPPTPIQRGGNAVEGSWPHLKYDFLQPDKIKDINKRSPSDPNYDPKTVYVPQDFKNNQTPAMRQWWELKSRHFDCVLFFKVGKFYELYHMDAVTGVNELGFSFMRGEFAHSGFPEIAYGRFSASLIERGYKVARVEQTENPSMMAERCSSMSKTTKFDKVVKREICQISTKGTRVYTAQDGLASSPNSNYLLALTEKCISDSTISSYGVCFLDTTIGDFHLGQFDDDNHCSRLLTLIAHYPPVHVIYERGNLSQRTMKILNTSLAAALKESLQRESQFWSAATTLKNLHEGGYFKSESDSNFSWPNGLRRYLNDGDSLGLTPAEDAELAISALGGCIYLLKEHLLDQQLLAQGRFESYVPPDFSDGRQTSKTLASNMVLDAITMHNLRIFGGESSLITILDHCCTAFGKRSLRQWICRPSCRKDVIIQRQKAVAELMDRVDVVQNARGLLGNLPDLERLLSKIHAQGNSAKMWNHPDGRAIMFEGKTYSKRKILDFTTTLDGFEEVLNLIALFDDFRSDLLKQCTQLEPEGDFPNLRESLDYFKDAFDHDEAKKEGCIVPKRGVDAEYDSVLEELSEIKKDLDSYLEQQRRHFDVKVKFYGSERKRYQIEVPDSQLKKVGSGYELQSQRKGFKRYYTAEAKDLLARQINAEELRDKVLKDLNRRIFAKFSEKYDMWSAAVNKIATLDVLISLAEYADSDMCVPEILDYTETQQASIEIRDGRHPCIVSDNFIPNDTFLASVDAASLVILTGPNMGGKSTLMRQTGLLTIMAQIGCHIPASSCRLTLVDRIFTRLGANDDILAGQSTFLVELSETASILHHASPQSLVLLDELGRGTSTYDGTAIAAAVVDALIKLKCCTLFSTHYHSLVEDFKKNENVTLAHMACMVETEDGADVSEETVTFLYKLTEGACPKSYGFNAARLAGVPFEIVRKARERATKLEQEVQHRRAFTALCMDDDNRSVKSLLASL